MRNGRIRALLGRARSLRGKIAAGYSLGFALLVAVASILFVNLFVVERRIGSYSGIARFVDAALEMRRYEKNYFLYGKEEDLASALDWAATATSIVEGLAPFGGMASGEPLPEPAPGGGEQRIGREGTVRLLEDYAGRLREAGRAGGRPPEATLDGVRDLGRRITRIAEDRFSIEGLRIQALLRSGRRTLVALVVLFLLGSAVIARVVRSTALRPLRELEAGMRRISAGELRMLPVGSAHDEIDSMNAAFNRMIQELFEHREELMRSEKLASLGTMLAGIAHEINNPLTNISTSAELLAEENEQLGPEQRRELIGQVLSQTERATEIIRTVLEYSREPRLERRPTPLLPALFESVVLVHGELPTHLTVNLDVAPEIEVLAHKSKLQQAFINLLTNAIDAMREAKRDGVIDVSARTPPGQGWVEISFRDTGAGIPRELVDRIFDPFFSTKDVGHGTGLGLYVVHRIVEQHAGTIRVESEVGEGTTFTIRLPRIEPGHPAAGEPRIEGEA